ncbi:ATP-binding protein [Scytonema sp. NUACC26]|uniref:ATP-binding protein n=1 Tax=Scytonema sp. NUACC26 TaxID=3140176 RepID=UPI0034DBFE79
MAENWFVGGGELGALLRNSFSFGDALRSHDWSQTPLGPIETWSEDLKTAVQLVLTELDGAQASEKKQQDFDLLEDSSAVAALHQANQLNAFRVKLADALRPLTDASEIQAIAARILGESLGATRVIYIEVVSNGEEVIVHRNYTNGVAQLSGHYRLDDYQRNLTIDHWAGRTQVVTDIPNNPRYTDAEKARYREIDIAAHIDVPLVKNNQFVALLAVHQSTPRQWTETEVKLVEETAERTWADVERAHAEKALRESEERYRTLFESIDEGFCIVEMLFDENDTPIDYRFLEINPVFEQQTGLQQAVGKTARQLVPDLEDFWVETYGSVALTGEPVRFENGSVPMSRWFDVYACRTGQPKDRKVAIVFKDISDRKRAEAALRDSEELKQRILESSKDCIKVLTLNSEIVYISTGGLCLLEIDDPTLALNARWLDFWQGEDYENAKTAIAAAKAGNTGQFQGYLPTYKGTPKYWDSIVTPVRNSAGQVTQLVAVSRDITKQKQAESERERLLAQEKVAREAAETANRLKDEFLAVLSHELRSPLNPILGWVQLLQKGKLDAARQREALATIERNAKLQTQLIEDLLDISRIMQGKLSLTIAPVSLNFVISAAVETVRLAAEAKDIQITLDLDTEIAPVSGDATRLQQAVWNLLGNAIKFTPKNGQAIVELRQLNRLAQIRVIDTGKGINPQFLPYVFEYFRQEDGSTTRKFGGLGLGLAIVRQIVEMHGGTVQAESQGEGQGATFTVQLPTMQQTLPIVSETILPQTDAGLPLEGIQILLVDDEPDTREFQAFLLEQSGARVTAVASGLEALLALEQSIPDVLVSDIGMAQMDGYMLLKEVRSRPYEQGGMIPAIALTAYAAEMDRQQALQVGFQTHITKPVEPEELVRAISRVACASRTHGLHLLSPS